MRLAGTGCASPSMRGEAVTRLPAAETSAGGIEGGIGKKPFEVRVGLLQP